MQKAFHINNQLKASVQDNVLRYSMEMEHVLDQESFCPHRQRELLEGNKVRGLGGPVDDGQHYSVTVRKWKICDEVQGDVGPGTLWGGKVMQETRRRLVGAPARAPATHIGERIGSGS